MQEFSAMDSISSRRNDSPFSRSNSYAASRRVDNSPRRQSSTIAGSSSSFRPGFSPQRTPYSSRQSLSRSYDSPEGIRRLSQISAKKTSSSLRRAASPPACSSSLKQHSSASGRNQTILDDAAWMSERLHNLQRTGFLRYPSISKLRDPVLNQADEPLSAFRLSEVTLSEEDLLTDISSSREFSTCTSTPVLLQASGNFDQIASELYQGSSLSQSVGKDYQKQGSVRPNGNVSDPHSAASSESTSSNVRGELLLRLEALQYRAELAAKGGNDSFSSIDNANQDNQNSKLFRSGHVLRWDQSALSSNQKWSAFSQQSNATSSASPTHSNLSIESTSWPEEPESSFDSTCWLKDVNEEAKAEPSARHLSHSSSRTIRPEYYLPLSKEEEPVFGAGASPFSSPKGGKRTELRNDNIRRLALGVCQRRSEEARPAKLVNNHKNQRSLAWKSKRFLQSSMDSANGNGSVKAGAPAASSPKPSLGVARRTLLTEARPSHNHLCAEHKGTTHLMQEQSKIINQSCEMKAFASEIDGQTRNSLENRFEYDGESSWISEENVEGFLCSRSFTLDKADALSTSTEWSSFLDPNLIHSTKRPSKNKSIEESQTKDSGKDLSSSSHTQSACFNEEAVEGSNESMARICMFDRCKEVHMSSQVGSTITSKTDTALQLLKEGSCADSRQAANISHQSVCQISHSGDEHLHNSLIACSCCKDTLNNERLLKESQDDAGVEEHISGKGDSSSWNAVSPKNLNIVIEESIENNMTLEAEKKLESTCIGQCHSARYSFHSSIPSVSEQQVPRSLDALSSPADLLVEDRYWPAIANRNANTTHVSKMHSQNLLGKGSSEHKVFARIVRSLSFRERGHSELKSGAKLQTSRDISESKRTGFAHYWIPNRAYSFNSFDLENKGGKYSMEMQQTTAQITKELVQEPTVQNGMGDMDRGPEGNGDRLILLDNSCTTDINIENNVGKYSMEMQQTTAQITKELMQEPTAHNGMGNMDRGPEGNGDRLIMLDNSCITDINIEQLAEEPCVMAHALLLSKSESILDSDREALITSTNFSQHCHDLQLASTIETHCNVQDESRIERVQEDINSWQQIINRVPKGGKTEADDKGCRGQSGEDFTVGEYLHSQTLQIEPDESEPEVILDKLTLSEEHMGIPSLVNQNKELVVEGAIKSEMVLKFPCTPGSENARRGETSYGRGETPSSLLSIYKNPLWRDEVNMDSENDHGSQNQEFLDCSYSDAGNLLGSDKNRIGFSKRSLGAVWDTYEGMGGFISPFPNSPSCTTKQTSEANHILVGFDNLINSNESNSFVLDSVWDVESSLKNLRNIGVEASEVPGFSTQPRLSCHSQVEQCHQHSAQRLETIESQTINHEASSLSPVNAKNVTSMVDGNMNTTPINLPLAHMGKFKATSHLKINLNIERDSISDSARIPDGLEDCLREHSVWPYASSSHSTRLIESNATLQDAALVANESTINDFFLNSEPKCNTWKKMVPLTEMSCKTDEVRTGREAFDQLDCNGNKIGRELTLQNSGASINIQSISASQCADKKLQTDPLCEQYNKECVQPAHHKLAFAKADASEDNQSIKDLVMHSNDGTEAGEKVKQVTFIYSDSKEPQKDLHAVKTSLPEVPLDLLSTWILSFFTHASKGGVNIKRKEQKQPLIHDKAREDQVELKRIGKKVQALEAEIDRFKQENRKLQSLMKCMIRKIKQLQQGLRGRKRNGSSRGFMTCIYLVRVKRSSKSKISRKS